MRRWLGCGFVVVGIVVLCLPFKCTWPSPAQPDEVVGSVVCIPIRDAPRAAASGDLVPLRLGPNRPDGTAGPAVVLDAIDDPSSDNEVVDFTCMLNGSPDPEIAALINLDSPKFIVAVGKACRFNRTIARIEALAPTGISCQNPAQFGD